MQVLRISLLASAFVVLSLPGCRFTSDSESVVISGANPIAYIKRPQASLGSAIDSKSLILGSELYLRELPSPDAPEFNITGSLTNGKGMVADPDASFDGNRIVFSMKCSVESSALCKDDTTWNIWIYDRRDRSLKRAISDFKTANLADDIDPAFLPNNKIIFSSTRQAITFQKTGFQYTDEDQTKRNPASVLHTLDLGSQVIEQISFNRSHDRNPSVMQNGKIVFSRWDRIGDRNQITIYAANPDGTDMNVLYGAHSPGEAFLHPKELPDGRLLSTVLPLSGTWEGGALMILDVKNYSDAFTPAPSVQDKSVSGQQSGTIQKIPIDFSVSRQGRFTTPFPLYDGSDQVIVSYSFFRPKSDAVNAGNSLAESVEATPDYGIYMLDLHDKSIKPIVLPNDGVVITDPIALYPRAEPPDIKRQITYNPGIFNSNNLEGIISVKSVYDTDKYERMGQGALTIEENVLTPIPLISSDTPLLDNRDYVADLATISDPLLTTADQRPARFVRVSKSIPAPIEISQQVLGLTNFEMQQLIGYAPVEPDGSFKIKVPADVPLAVTVLDKYGRAFENHTSWLQVRPGETLTCNGCHSPSHTMPLNKPAAAPSHPNTSLRNLFGHTLSAAVLEGESMAETRTRVDETALELSQDIKFDDVWTNGSRRELDAPINYSYATLQTRSPVNGIINYSDHIQPIWDKSCISCHNGIKNNANNPSGLNLNSFVGGSGRNFSYDTLLTGREVYDEKGLPYLENIGSALTLKKGLPLVSAGYARGSHIVEILFNEELFAEKSLQISGVDHSAMLSNAEKRLIVEWIDLGAMYFNNPFDENGNLRVLTNTLDFNAFANQLYQQFIVNCAACHSPVTIGGQKNSGYVPTNFILMRATQSDYSSVVNMVTDPLVPSNSYIVTYPSDASGEHNRNHDSPSLPAEAYMPSGGAFYNQVINWIKGTGQ